MIKVRFLIIVILLLILGGLVYGQGTAHLVYGYVNSADGGVPDSICFIFKAWIIGGNDTLSHETEGCGYNDGVWGVQVSQFEAYPNTGDTLVVSFEDTCKGEIGVVWGLINMSAPGHVQSFESTELVDTSLAVAPKNHLPSDLTILNAYPNPFNSNCRIEIRKSAREARVNIINILGQECLELYRGPIEGSLTLQWNGRDNRSLLLPGGNYICRVQLDQETIYQPINFLK
ncbi:T9SS type A sorting domain-containing protein [bacterium]|nr:T9SS type A sorting domain-containing protein [bacterium]